MKNKRRYLAFALAFCVSLAAYTAGQADNRIVVISNSIDGALAQELYWLLENAGMVVVRANGATFQSYATENFIVVLGGHHAPEGVGDIVDSLLTDDEKELILSSNTSSNIFVKTNVWAKNQLVLVFAGYEREQTQLAWQENKERLLVGAAAASTTTPAPTGSCRGFCMDSGFAGGVCRLSPAECRIRGKDEVYQPKGDQFCRYRTGHDDTCCCVVG